MARGNAVKRTKTKGIGPAKMKANFLTEAAGGGVRLAKGYTGLPGYRYHPTKGYRKEAGFRTTL